MAVLPVCIRMYKFWIHTMSVLIYLESLWKFANCAVWSTLNWSPHWYPHVKWNLKGRSDKMGWFLRQMAKIGRVSNYQKIGSKKWTNTHNDIVTIMRGDPWVKFNANLQVLYHNNVFQRKLTPIQRLQLWNGSVLLPSHTRIRIHKFSDFTVDHIHQGFDPTIGDSVQ